MKLPIEVWLSEEKLTDATRTLFKESSICFRAEAYKASLLYSYLGFMLIVKERILQSKAPNGIPQSKWEKTASSLKNEEGWDKAVYEALQTKKPANYFRITETLRREITYWKDRRNDCAHFKNETIDAHHVESFWSFLEHNLPKITVEGGMLTLISKFKDHFDVSFTPLHEDYSNLIKEIEFSVAVNELYEFFAKLVSIIFESTSRIAYYEVLHKIIKRYDNTKISEELIRFMKTNQDLVGQGFLRHHPEYLLDFNFNKKEVRKIWYEKLFSTYHNDNPIYCALLKNKLIPEQDILEAHKTIINRTHDAPLTNLQVDILDENNFFKLFIETVESNYHQGYFSSKQADNHSVFIVASIKKYGFKESIVRCINRSFDRRYNPSRLKHKLKTLFEENPKSKTEYWNMSKTLDYPVPNTLQAYFSKEASEETFL